MKQSGRKGEVKREEGGVLHALHKDPQRVKEGACGRQLELGMMVGRGSGDGKEGTRCLITTTGGWKHTKLRFSRRSSKSRIDRRRISLVKVIKEEGGGEVGVIRDLSFERDSGGWTRGSINGDPN